MTDDITYPDPREQKLPRWAQETLVRLRRELTNAQEHAARAIGENVASTPDPFAWVDPYGDHPLPVAGRFDVLALTVDGDPRGARNYQTGNEVHVTPLRGGSDDRLWRLSCPEGLLFVRPVSSNVVTVGVWHR